MTSRKPRIIHVVPAMSTAGGPAGYAYRLRSALAEHSSGEFDVSFFESPGKPHEYRMTLRRHMWLVEALARGRVGSNGLVQRVADLVLRTEQDLQQRWHPGRVKIGAMVDAFVEYCAPPNWNRSGLRDADVVIFHAILAASEALRRRGRKGPIIAVMPHSPTPISAEVAGLAGANALLPELARDSRYRSLLREELRLYRKADIIVAPCSSAFEAYRSLGGAWAQALHESRIATCWTGTPPPPVLADRAAWRRRLGIREGSLLAAYVGRYHIHKGFDLLEPVMKEVNRRIPGRITLVCAGGPAPKENSDGIHHVGFTNDVGGLVSAADFVVVPCRYAYFDLSALECCALGRPMLMTRVGGHRDLAEMVPAIRAVDASVEALVQGFLAMANDPAREERGREIRLAYEEFFSPRAFAQNHLRLYREILDRAARFPS